MKKRFPLSNNQKNEGILNKLLKMAFNLLSNLVLYKRIKAMKTEEQRHPSHLINYKELKFKVSEPEVGSVTTDFTLDCHWVRGYPAADNIHYQERSRTSELQDCRVCPYAIWTINTHDIFDSFGGKAVRNDSEGQIGVSASDLREIYLRWQKDRRGQSQTSQSCSQMGRRAEIDQIWSAESIEATFCQW